MPKLENPITGQKYELTNWKRILGLVGGIILIAGVVVSGLWLFNKAKGMAGVPESGSTLNDILGGI